MTDTPAITTEGEVSFEYMVGVLAGFEKRKLDLWEGVEVSCATADELAEAQQDLMRLQASLIAAGRKPITFVVRDA